MLLDFLVHLCIQNSLFRLPAISLNYVNIKTEIAVKFGCIQCNLHFSLVTLVALVEICLVVLLVDGFLLYPNLSCPGTQYNLCILGITECFHVL